MTLKECYFRLGGVYEDALRVLMNEKLIDKFIVRFPAEPTMDSLRKAYSERNVEQVFADSHTLKGLAGNLGLKKLYQAASALTEQVRPRNVSIDDQLYKEVEEAYDLTVDTIAAYIAEK